MVVIEAGHNGLVCACYLALAGYRVQILQKILDRRSLCVNTLNRAGLLYHPLNAMAHDFGCWGHAIRGISGITPGMQRETMCLGVAIEISAEVTRIEVAGNATGCCVCSFA